MLILRKLLIICKLNINIKDQADEYGKDVSISVDTWKPEEISKQNINRICDYIIDGGSRIKNTDE